MATGLVEGPEAKRMVARKEREKIVVALPDTATKIPFMYSFSGNCAASVPHFHIHVSVSDLYIPRIGPQSAYFLKQNNRIDPGNI
jgi:hypothetical protein